MNETQNYEPRLITKKGWIVIIISTLIMGFLTYKCVKIAKKAKEEINKEYSYCECHNWGKELKTKEIQALQGNSEDMKKVEDETKEWNNKCREKMFPTTESGKMKFLEEIEKCK